jgi:acyl dehydratase
LAEAVPPPEKLVRFLVACAALHLPFKATAGLHHPLRSEQAYTYAADSPRGVMHGFLNVFVAAALLREGRIDAAGASNLLSEGRAEAFAFEGDELRVGPYVLNARELASARAGFATCFGSCSFAEPVSDLQALGLLAAAS